MIIAQVPNEAWMLGFASLLAVVWLARQLWTSFFSGDYVTRKELVDAIGKLENVISNHVPHFVGRSEYISKHEELNRRVDELSHYMHQRMHDLLTGQQTMVNKLDVTMQMVNREIGRRQGTERAIKNEE